MSERVARPGLELVERLVQQGYIRGARLADAFRAVPRHVFVPHVSIEEAYADRPIPLKCEHDVPISSSSQPAMMALMLETLAPRPGERILEIGAGSGYNAALLAYLVAPGGFVATIDVESDLVEAARRALDDAGFAQVKTIAGDGALGDPRDAPFDAIEASVAVAETPPAWIEQVHDGGRVMAPLIIGLSQKIVLFDRLGPALASRAILDGAFMLLRGPAAANDEAAIVTGDPPVTVYTLEPASIDAAELAEAFDSAPATFVPSRPLSADDVWSGLALWLDVHERAQCRTRRRIGAREGPFPTLLSESEGDRRGVAHSIGLCRDGAAALFDANERDGVVIRSFGDDGACVERLLRSVDAWHAAGRPSNDGLHIEIVPRDDRGRRVRERTAPERCATIRRAASDVDLWWDALGERAAR